MKQSWAKYTEKTFLIQNMLVLESKIQITKKFAK